jgi:hypothetical protein
MIRSTVAFGAIVPTPILLHFFRVGRFEVRKTSTRWIAPNAVMRLNGCPLRQEINRRWSR